MALIGNFQHFAITHIRRESNADADRLAKEAIDRATCEKQPANNDPSEGHPLLGDPRRLVQIGQPG